MMTTYFWSFYDFDDEGNDNLCCGTSTDQATAREWALKVWTREAPRHACRVELLSITTPATMSPADLAARLSDETDTLRHSAQLVESWSK